jgi:hypothetical protein
MESKAMIKRGRSDYANTLKLMFFKKEIRNKELEKRSTSPLIVHR